MKNHYPRLNFLALLLMFTLVFTSFSYADTATPLPQVYAGENHSVIVKADGTLWTFGGNHIGQLGTGKKTDYNSSYVKVNNQDKNKPVKIMDNVIKAAVGSGHTLALTKTNTLYGFGSNRAGQLGIQKPKYALKPVKLMTNIKDVFAGDYGTAVIKMDNSLWYFGANYQPYSEISTDGEPISFTSKPVKIMDNVRTASFCSYYFMILTTNNELYMFGNPRYLGSQYQKLDANTNTVKKPVKIRSDVASIVGTSQTPMFITTSGELYGWGFNAYSGRLGLNSKEFLITDPTLIAENVLKAVAGFDVNFFITTDHKLMGMGTLEDSCNMYIGNAIRGGSMLEKTIVKYDSSPVLIQENILDISADAHILAIDKDQKLWVWGNNENGKLGNGTTSVYDYKTVGSDDESYDEFYLKTDKHLNKPTLSFSLLK